jgi:DNA-binding response OmpR family regulator
MEKKVLIVDDNLRVRELLYNTLTKQGYKVITATEGKQALELFGIQKPDLILLDFKMPDLNGVEVLTKIKSLDNKVKIIMLTGYESEGLEKQARLLGASGFLPKSSGMEVIVKAVNEILQPKGEYKEDKILVVDDDPKICELLEKFLVKKGFQPITALNAEDGLEKVRKEKPKLVLLDIKLPGMDGLVALKKIREADENIGVIMITGVEDQTIAQQAIDSGAYDYIVKPFDLDYLEISLLTKITLLSG